MTLLGKTNINKIEVISHFEKKIIERNPKRNVKINYKTF